MKRRTECALCGVLVRRRTGAMAYLRDRRNRTARKRVCAQCARDRCILIALDLGTWGSTSGRRRSPGKQRTLLFDDPNYPDNPSTPVHSGEKGSEGFDGA